MVLFYFFANPDFTLTPGIFPSFPVSTPNWSVVMSTTSVMTDAAPLALGNPVRESMNAEYIPAYSLSK